MSKVDIFLSSLQKFGIKLGLEQINCLLESAGNPERGLRFIHVAGSNGKGSVSAMLERALRSSGFKTGLFTSPHLVSIFERFRINGKAICQEEFDDIAMTLIPAAQGMAANGCCPTFFEFTTAMATVYFKRNEVDWVIWETGMGGRLDATNAITPEVAVITSISLEHQEHLGNTIAAIAGEKAGIIKPAIEVFIGKIPHEAEVVISAKCHELGATLRNLDNDQFEQIKTEYDGNRVIQSFDYRGKQYKLGMAGAMQRENFRLAAAVVFFLSARNNFNPDVALGGLAEINWPARMQAMPDGTIVDGGHNPEGASALCKALQEIFPHERFSIIFGNFKDKDSDAILSELVAIASEFIFVPISDGMGRQGRGSEELIALLRRHTEDMPARCASSLSEALSLNCCRRRLVTGSLYLAGAALEMFLPQDRILNI